MRIWVVVKAIDELETTIAPHIPISNGIELLNKELERNNELMNNFHDVNNAHQHIREELQSQYKPYRKINNRLNELLEVNDNNINKDTEPDSNSVSDSKTEHIISNINKENAASYRLTLQQVSNRYYEYMITTLFITEVYYVVVLPV